MHGSNAEVHPSKNRKVSAQQQRENCQRTTSHSRKAWSLLKPRQKAHRKQLKIMASFMGSIPEPIKDKYSDFLAAFNFFLETDQYEDSCCCCVTVYDYKYVPQFHFISLQLLLNHFQVMIEIFLLSTTTISLISIIFLQRFSSIAQIWNNML